MKREWEPYTKFTAVRPDQHWDYVEAYKPPAPEEPFPHPVGARVRMALSLEVPVPYGTLGTVVSHSSGVEGAIVQWDSGIRSHVGRLDVGAAR